MKNILITGATGFVGKALTLKLIEEGHDVVVVSRSSEAIAKLKLPLPVTHIQWEDPANTPVPKNAVQGLDGVINLAGEPIADKRWSDKRKKQLRESRIDFTEQLIFKAKVAIPRKVDKDNYTIEYQWLDKSYKKCLPSFYAIWVCTTCGYADFPEYFKIYLENPTYEFETFKDIVLKATSSIAWNVSVCPMRVSDCLPRKDSPNSSILVSRRIAYRRGTGVTSQKRTLTHGTMNSRHRR